MTEEGSIDTIRRRAFNIAVPSGFIGLPASDIDGEQVDESLRNQVSEALGIDSSSEDLDAASASFSSIGAMFGEAGVEYSAIGFFLSPEDTSRPVMVTICGMTMSSDHQRQNEAVTNLLDFYENHTEYSAREVSIQAGPAVIVINEEENALVIDGSSIPVLTRYATAWVPDPEGTTLGIVSVMTNSYQDWEHVCTLALDIFDSFDWEST